MTLEEAYRIYLGREPDEGGLAANKQLYGSTLDEGELERFLYGAAPEIRSRDLSGGDFTVEDLYLGGLRRAADPGGFQFYQKEFGPEISDQEIVRFMLSGAGELPDAPMYRTADETIRTIADVTDRGTGNTVVSETPEQKAERARIDALMARKGDLTKFITPLLENVPYGRKLGTASEIPTNVGLLNLYQNVLGRRPDEAGYRSNLAAFGPTMDLQEIADFRTGAVPELDRQRIAQEQLVDKIRTGAASNLVAAPTRPTLAQNFQYVPGSLTSIPQNIVDLYQTELGRAPDVAGGMNRAYMYGPSIEPGELANFQQGAIDSGERKYAGGPVTGSPQYFAEGGESKGMAKYGAKDLGSTFDISEYIDESGKLVGGQLVPVVEEGVTVRYDYKPYERDVVFGKDLRSAEAEARASMSPEEEKRALQALMIRRGQTGREYGLPLVASGLASSGVRPMNQYAYAEGGLADIARRGYAEEIRRQGRNGDTILAHINPAEAKMLEAMGGSGEINPRTGLPEYGFSWKKLFKVAGKILPFVPIPGLFGLSSLLTKSIASGLLAGASGKGGFNIKRALGAGAMSYGLGSIADKVMGNAPSDAATLGQDLNSISPVGAQATDAIRMPADVLPGELGDIPIDAGGKVLLSPERISTNTISNVVPTETGKSLAYSESGRLLGEGNILPAETGDLFAKTVNPPGSQGLTSNLYTEGPGISLTEKPLTTIEAAGTALTGYGMEKGADAEDKAKAQQALMLAEQEDREKMMRDLAERLFRENPYGYAGGGAIDPVGYEGGGMTASVNQPRMLAGGGDGMSDSIPATIDGTQPARLADGEFVVPADVVADIGNGSSSAGAKRLYGMMDRVRQARHGTTKQPPEIKMNRLMPA